MTERAPEHPKHTRRAWLDAALSTVAASVGVATLYPVARFLAPLPTGTDSSVVIGPAEDFPRGQARNVLVGGRPVLVIRAADGSFRALSAICTHLQCVVRYVPEHDWIECACHEGRFSADGQPLAGPVSAPLEPLRVEVVDGSLVVSVS